MNQAVFEILRNEPLAGKTYEMTLRGDPSALTAPGQFVDAALPGLFLRRPFSVSRRGEDTITLVYRAVGGGTEEMALMKPGLGLDLLCGLGNGFSTAKCGGHPLLIGGGTGAAPLRWLCEELRRAGLPVTVALGFNTADEIYYADAFRETGADLLLATADGSAGRKGFVTDLLPGLRCSYFYACGPLPMLRAVCRAPVPDGEISLEARMGCGFGACMGCSVETAHGPKRICRDGPVFAREELPWLTQA